MHHRSSMTPRLPSASPSTRTLWSWHLRSQFIKLDADMITMILAPEIMKTLASIWTCIAATPPRAFYLLDLPGTQPRV